MLDSCFLTRSSNQNTNPISKAQIRQLALEAAPSHITLVLDHTVSLEHPTFQCRVGRHTILTNGLAAYAIARTQTIVMIGSSKIELSQFTHLKTLNALETNLYELAAAEFGSDWLAEFAERSLPQIRERERRLSILRAHLSVRQPNIKRDLANPIASITSHLASQGTRTWI